MHMRVKTEEESGGDSALLEFQQLAEVVNSVSLSQPGLQIEFQDSQGYIETLSQKQPTKQTNKSLRWGTPSFGNRHETEGVNGYLKETDKGREFFDMTEKKSLC